MPSSSLFHHSYHARSKARASVSLLRRALHCSAPVSVGGPCGRAGRLRGTASGRSHGVPQNGSTTSSSSSSSRPIQRRHFYGGGAGRTGGYLNERPAEPPRAYRPLGEASRARAVEDAFGDDAGGSGAAWDSAAGWQDLAKTMKGPMDGRAQRTQAALLREKISSKGPGTNVIATQAAFGGGFTSMTLQESHSRSSFERQVEHVERLATMFKDAEVVSDYCLNFLDTYAEYLQKDGQFEDPLVIANQIHRLIVAFSRIEFDRPAKMRFLYRHIANVDGLSTESAIVMAWHMLWLKRYSAEAIENLLAIAMESVEMTHIHELKCIEILLRLSSLDVKRSLDGDILQYLSAIRNWSAADLNIPLTRNDSILAYQLAHFLSRHGFPNETLILGPYGLNLCDTSKKVVFLEKKPVDPALKHFPVAPGMAVDGEGAPGNRSPTTGDAGFSKEMQAFESEYKKEHLQALGWKVVEVRTKVWETYKTRAEKASFVRELLKKKGLLRRG